MFEVNNMIVSVVFGIIGFGAFRYGKGMEYWKPLAIGIVLMMYPLFTPNWIWTLAVGLILVVLLWFYHDE
jgi:integral membrane sensor domain MASE1